MEADILASEILILGSEYSLLLGLAMIIGTPGSNITIAPLFPLDAMVTIILTTNPTLMDDYFGATNCSSCYWFVTFFALMRTEYSYM